MHGSEGVSGPSEFNTRLHQARNPDEGGTADSPEFRFETTSVADAQSSRPTAFAEPSPGDATPADDNARGQGRRKGISFRLRRKVLHGYAYGSERWSGPETPSRQEILAAERGFIVRHGAGAYQLLEIRDGKMSYRLSVHVGPIDLAACAAPEVFQDVERLRMEVLSRGRRIEELATHLARAESAIAEAYDFLSGLDLPPNSSREGNGLVECAKSTLRSARRERPAVPDVEARHGQLVAHLAYGLALMTKPGSERRGVAMMVAMLNVYPELRSELRAQLLPEYQLTERWRAVQTTLRQADELLADVHYEILERRRKMVDATVVRDAAELDALARRTTTSVDAILENRELPTGFGWTYGGPDRCPFCKVELHGDPAACPACSTPFRGG